jgi:cytochrome c oxidase assembly protein subunit 15
MLQPPLRRMLLTLTPPPGVALHAAPSAAAAAASAPAVAVAVPRAIGWWLLGSATSVFGMVVLGGYTRLTRSGLSMTDWRPEGTRLPSGADEWEAAFSRYKQFPEFQISNADMALDEFKQIYFVEWAHRMAGRGVGLIYGLPLLAFAAAGMVPRALAPRLVLLFAMGGSQGLVGWWMVKSGLEAPPADLDGVPRVSPYRLACHLAMAFTIFSGLFITSLQVLLPEPHGDPAKLSAAARAAVARARGPAHALAGLIAFTAISGAFVAGMGAGFAYNTFPLMEGRLVPAAYFKLEPAWRNVFENVPAVQFDHRVLAVSTLAGVGSFWVYARALPLPPAAKLATHALLIGAGAQVRARARTREQACERRVHARTRVCQTDRGRHRARERERSERESARELDRPLLTQPARAPPSHPGRQASAHSAPACCRLSLAKRRAPPLDGRQVCLGIVTLLNAVPVSLGTAHQAGALGLFSITLTVLHTLRRLPL